MLSTLRTTLGSGPKRCNVAARAASTPPTRGNVDGQFWVDETCIDCDTCRWMSPGVFTRVGEQSAVTAQPQDRPARIASIQAALSCPTFSIHMRTSDKEELKEAQRGMPIPVEGCQNVYICGFNSEKSYGATSYLIVRPEGGNILMDCPRFSPLLAKHIGALGGVSHIVLSHIDDVADHDRWAAHFKCGRVMHEAEIRPALASIETQLRGSGPWNLQGEPIAHDATDGGVLLIHTPGHTQGSISLWHAASQTMFTGDHLGFSNRLGRVTIFPRYNRGGVRTQLESVKKLLQWDFLHVLPGHGRAAHVRDATARLKLVSDVVEAELALT